MNLSVGSPSRGDCLELDSENLRSIAAFVGQTNDGFGNWFPLEKERSLNFWCLGWLVPGASVKVASERLN